MRDCVRENTCFKKAGKRGLCARYLIQKPILIQSGSHYSCTKLHRRRVIIRATSTDRVFALPVMRRSLLCAQIEHFCTYFEAHSTTLKDICF